MSAEQGRPIPDPARRPPPPASPSQPCAKRRGPVHPAYAMTYGGGIPRSKPRVHALGTLVGDQAWEQFYYGDVQ